MTKYASAVLLYNDKREILAVSRRHEDIYGLPGGKRDDNETIKQSAVRELYEETGVSVSINDLIPIYQDDSEDGYNVTTYVAHWEKYMGEPKQMEDGIKVEWMDQKKFLDKNAFYDYNREVISTWNHSNVRYS